METKICTFEENQITFALEKNNGMMINATEMAKAFNRDLYQFTKSEDTKRFIESCLKPANAGLLGIVNDSDLISNYSAKTSADNQIYTNQQMKHFDCTAREIYHNGEIHNQMQYNCHDLHLFFIKVVYL